MPDNVTIDNGALTDFDVSADASTTGDRKIQRVKLAYSADGDETHVNADALGLQVCPSVRLVRIEMVVPGVSTTAYAVNDQVGTKITFANAARITGGTGQIRSGTLTSRSANTIVPNLDLLLFRNDPTVASADSAVANITDANLEAADYFGTIEFRTADYDILSANTVCAGVNKPVDLVFLTGSNANIYGLMVTRTAFTLASAADNLTVTLRIAQD